MSNALVQDEQFVSADGVDVRVECIRPADEEKTKRPVVLVLHGSDAFTVHGLFYRQMARQFARAGFVALLPHYYDRTGSEYLADDLARRELVSTHFEDWVGAVTSVVDRVGTQSFANADRVGIFGVSLGAALGLGVASRRPDIRCVVEYFGWLHRVVDAATLPPTLILHGDSDETIPVSEAHRLSEAMTEAGRPFEKQIYPGQGHGFTGEAGRDAYVRSLEFLKRHIA